MHNTHNYFNSGNLHNSIVQTCLEFAVYPAVTCGAESYSYADLFNEYYSFQQFLKLLPERETVLVKLSNKKSSLPLILAGITSPQVPLFCDPVWKEEEILKILKRNGTCYYISEEENPFDACTYACMGEKTGYKLYQVFIAEDELEQNNLLSETAFCRFTSGTTGFSRCLQFSEKAFMSAGYYWWRASAIKHKDVVYCLSTLNNGLAFNTSILSVLFSGAHLVIHNGNLIPSSIKKTLLAHKPSILIAFPFVYEQLIHAEKITRNDLQLRLAISSAAPLKEASSHAWEEKFGIGICNYYGIAEVGPCTFNTGDETGTLGKLLENADIEFEALGESDSIGKRILVRTTSMALAYLDAYEPAFAERINPDGYYISNDRGFISLLGNLVLTGRIDRTINIEGRKIDPVEIENLIKTISTVTDVYVSKKQVLSRDVVAAYIEGNDIDAETVTKLCVKVLAQYKIPQYIKILETFPRSSTGKVSAGLLEIY
jgi:acyl-coenzyme A synthetase/AMP-(fatty) acid ligase